MKIATFGRRTAPVLTLLLLAACQSPGQVKVTVSNQSTQDLTDVQVMAGQSTLTFSRLAAGASQSASLNVAADSGLRLTYVREGQLFSKTLEAYLTPGLHGSLDLTIQADQNVVLKTNLRTGFF